MPKMDELVNLVKRFLFHPLCHARSRDFSSSGHCYNIGRHGVGRNFRIQIAVIARHLDQRRFTSEVSSPLSSKIIFGITLYVTAFEIYVSGIELSGFRVL